MRPIFILHVLSILFFSTIQAQLKKSPDYETAKTEAKKENKDILIVLTGSEWCKPCIKMKKNVFENQEFEDYANEHFVIFEVNLGRHWDMDSKLYKDYAFFKEKYQSNALPTLIVLDSNEVKKAVISEKLASFESTMHKLKQLE